MIRLYLVVFIALIASANTTSNAQNSSISGQITFEGSRITEAKIILIDHNIGAQSDEQGRRGVLLPIGGRYCGKDN